MGREFRETSPHDFGKEQDPARPPHLAIRRRLRRPQQGVDSQGKAVELFRQFIADFDSKTDPDAKRGVRGDLLDQARQELKEIQLCGLGKKAQAIDGKDLDGKPLKLSDHNGKVVLLVFWASWCKPCMADLPHEIELVKRFQNRPFVLVGVNGDDELDAANQAVKKAGIPWRSIADGKRGNGPIAESWAVAGWPTVYMIDHTGVIRENRLRGKRLDQPLEALISDAEKAGKR
jgi:thiol-disulfide isomerase/thioredoxin